MYHLVAADKAEFRIGELARMTGVSTRQLRYWEKQGYVSAIARDDEQESRLYGFPAYVKVTIIKQHLDDGESLHEAVAYAQKSLQRVEDFKIAPILAQWEAVFQQKFDN
ncbi:MerR family transcriptional regulator|uniref:MerR family transcriptional regulator n=1 Tax=Leuconostoc lactis TaxID=1246 RepID=A0A6L7A7U2_LEULA|nr:MerR family transcriptional regulator [Leuconostoc lactis]